MTRRQLLLRAILAAFGPIVFLAAEAISALGWTAGTYNYGHNFISDLGTRVCTADFGGRAMCSPLWPVMTFGFVAMGAAVMTTMFLLARSLTKGRRITVSVLGISVLVGMLLVAIFPGGIESVASGAIALHALGAGIAIAAGNLLAIVLGSARTQLGMPRWYAYVIPIIGVIGLVGLVFTVTPQSIADPAIFERIAVYSIFAWQLITSALLFRRAVTTP
ncbi:DUF998 domain-containing protein [Glaciihabitans arcticus]|uniref:DUF998 domain-containing protein n=1 Tax=Glaciihabitans arcticus TaxID=2668039 RepID=A0A4Q9GN48_9MICO|nr:DUF998 domain-containing protein [Glaciihabitans arcticus]TBN56222.1 DUF998 domain-containing protein [Glaciihabitans arcticus]